MNKNAKIALFSGAGLLGFTLAYVAFALVLGAQPHQIPVAGALFPTPPEQAQQSREQSGEPAPVATSAAVETRTVSAGLLDVFQIESPYSAKELEGLVAELKRKSKELDQRLLELGERERRSSERAEFLDEQYAELQRLRAGLEHWETELEQRQGEIESSESARQEREGESWPRLAKLFAEGEAAEQGKRLAQYAPEDAARILQALKPARAKELLDNVGAERWREYADAYRLAATPAGN